MPLKLTNKINVITISFSFYVYVYASLLRNQTVLCSVSLVKGLNRELGHGLTH